MSNRKLVITADDFGFDPATNRTILDLLSKGQVTATTVMAVSPFAGDGAESLADYGNGLGLHFILNSDQGREPWLPASDEMAEIFEQYPFSPAQAEAGATPAAVTAELDAQYAAMDDLGLNPTRLDSHSGTLYGLHGKPFIGEALQFCAAKGLGFRMPRSLRMYFGENVPAPIREMHAQAVQVADQLGVPLTEEMASNQVAPKVEIVAARGAGHSGRWDGHCTRTGTGRTPQRAAVRVFRRYGPLRRAGTGRTGCRPAPLRCYLPGRCAAGPGETVWAQHLPAGR